MYWVLLKIKEGSLSTFLASVLFGLKLTNHWEAHEKTISKSRFIIPSIWSKEDPAKYKELPSANKLVRLETDSAISFTYIKNKSGSKTDP